MEKTEGTMPDLESVKKYLEKRLASTVDDEFPPKFLQHLILRALRLDLIEPGRVVFSMNIPPRLLNSGKYLHGGAITTLVDIAGGTAIPAAGFPWKSGVSVEINISCLDAAYVNVSLFQSLITLALSLILQFL
ncbi:acyl-coenzyme A thioesterase-like protein [Medicago truncatula]|uniref:Acyl-coenzyme A thioesterase-like protein n=1 Tax=Medicago truncatula TaxID=3880 RepID=A0A072V2T3_MEDTR|nr:acyl-coenzyme A thioesterase-like protein [Medicago truncatula]